MIPEHPTPPRKRLPEPFEHYIVEYSETPDTHPTVEVLYEYEPHQTVVVGTILPLSDGYHASNHTTVLKVCETPAEAANLIAETNYRARNRERIEAEQTAYHIARLQAWMHET